VTPFDELWRDAENAVLAAFRAKEERIGGACGHCPDRGICGGGCRVRAYRATGDLYAPDPFCTAGRNAG
jgi:radical SAM protein with 4Fe4S-binding SPASM domain